MDQTTDQIEAHIEQTRAALQSDVRELQRRVKSATDWRQLFRKRPWVMCAAAFGVGFLISLMLERRKRQSRGASHPDLQNVVKRGLAV